LVRVLHQRSIVAQLPDSDKRHDGGSNQRRQRDGKAQQNLSIKSERQAGELLSEEVSG
jgi:hypothetical protein